MDNGETYTFNHDKTTSKSNVIEYGYFSIQYPDISNEVEKYKQEAIQWSWKNQALTQEIDALKREITRLSH